MLIDWRDSGSNPCTVDTLKDLVKNLPEDADLCPSCLSQLVEAEDEDSKFWLCPNEMCLDERQWVEED